uniref:Protection of telomeres protein 1 n=1 Tax=Trichobilharzia regenti TaxID=157069 RepID=A0AA85JCL0_TRIRE|nr:unnamed protein product [Trichobilharzia regenti]
MPKYIYVDLKSASGCVNVIAVVKFFDKPKKTKGSGYSLFLSVTDPSLCGDKMSCIIFHDSEENLPQIRTPGDIIIMHRLVVKQYNGRNQGCGYGTTGFSAAVFSGVPSDPLTPFNSPTQCSFGEKEVEVVKNLKKWYTSPDCPVEKENLSVRNTSTHSGQLGGIYRPGVRRIRSLKADEFCTIEGQVISIYKSTETDRTLVIYIWDGAVLPGEQNTVFMGPSEKRLCEMLPHSQHDPQLAALTGHNLQHWNENEIVHQKKYSLITPQDLKYSKHCRGSSIDFTDWSVPVAIYDEHVVSEPVKNLKPGDLIRIHNVHVISGQSKHDDPCSLRLILHGGKAREYGREVKYLGDSCLLINHLNDSSNASEDTEQLPNEANRYGLLDNLKAGLELRPPLLHPQPDFLLPYELQQPLTIYQIYNLPLIVEKKERELQTWDLLFPLTTQILPSVPPSSWLVVDNLPRSASNLNVVCTRLCARIIDVAPLSVQALKDCLWLTCKKCSISQRSSCISNIDITDFRCRW